MKDETNVPVTGFTRREVIKATSMASLAAAFHATGGAFAGSRSFAVQYPPPSGELASATWAK